MIKKYMKFLFGLFLGFGPVIGVFLLIYNLESPKTPLEAEQVWEILESEGYEPYDSTELYKDAWGWKDNSLTSAVKAAKDDIVFDYFVFENDGIAEGVRKRYRHWIRDNRYDIPNVEIVHCIRNYMIYTIEVNGMYTVCIRVGNTVVCAESKAENAGILNKVLWAMDYLK